MMTESEWNGLGDFLTSMTYWHRIQHELAPTLGRRADDLLMYEAPYLDGNRIRIPNGPAFARDSEGYRELSILKDAEGFSICSTGVMRADEFADKVRAWFGTFDTAAKSFLYTDVCTPTFMQLDQVGEERLTDELDGMGLRPGWESRQIEGPTGHPRALYFDSQDPSLYYMTFTGDTRTSHMVTKSFREINELYAAELGLDRLDIPIPDTTT